MLGFTNARMILSALGRSQAVIHFTPEGKIIKANPNFLGATKYSHSEIVGKHHQIFCDPEYAKSTQYREFWEALKRGEFQSGEFKRFDKFGKEVWIQATYNPVRDPLGRVVRVVKFASDITAKKMFEKEIQDRSQAVIEFLPDGTILNANSLFTQTTGYGLDEIRGRHHRMFMPPEDAETEEYRQFWPQLANGEYKAGEFRRHGKGGKEIFLQGSYNPVLNSKGEVERVVKTVADITEQVHAKNQSTSIGTNVATSVNEMNEAIREIAGRMTQTSMLADQADGSAKTAASEIDELLRSSENITRVVNVIETIADQTSLLALNATIEAARAGESGKGFAVVANEVKTLAAETATATDEIKESIGEIQAKITSTVNVMQEIADGISEVTANATSVAASVEEQSAVMGQMSDTAQELLTLSS